MRWLLYVIFLMVALAAGFMAGRNTTPSEKPLSIETRIDTVRDTVPVPVPEKEIIVRWLPAIGDTIRDTVYIPIVQKEYNTELYHAWVSGYNAQLDSIHVYSKTQTVYVQRKMRRWGLSITAGYGFSKDGLSPAIVAGVSYRIW